MTSSPSDSASPQHSHHHGTHLSPRRQRCYLGRLYRQESLFEATSAIGADGRIRRISWGFVSRRFYGFLLGSVWFYVFPRVSVHSRDGGLHGGYLGSLCFYGFLCRAAAALDL